MVPPTQSNPAYVTTRPLTPRLVIAERLWVDAIIDPAKTREVLMTALEACALNPEVERFNPGVIQT